ncbi:MAG TPA: DUF2027 domain-containing protein [Bacteroidales bacterium]|nr:DUF2027 domain-containing protein [Bacteroidales bacterium]
MPVLNVGDKVKFLNAPGGGFVTRVIDSRSVNVMIDEGFEIPTLASELIRVDSVEPAARFFDEPFDPVLRTTGTAPEEEGEEEGDDRLKPLPPHLVKNRKSEEIVLAFVPHDQKWFITGPVDVYLVNNSRYDMLYSIFSRTPVGHFAGLDYGNIFPDSKLLVATINREQLTHWTEGCMQFLFHADQLPEVPPPFNSEFRIEGRRFFKEGNYRDFPPVNGRAIVVRVLTLSDYFNPGGEKLSQGDRPVASGEAAPWIRKHQTARGEAVVDLHIHELVEDPANLEGSEILEFQKNYFLKCLDSAIAGQYRRVVFIHGIGSGTLRSLLLDLLKKQEGIEFFDAPMSEYGAGAIEVRIAPAKG